MVHRHWSLALRSKVKTLAMSHWHITRPSGPPYLTKLRNDRRQLQTIKGQSLKCNKVEENFLILNRCTAASTFFDQELQIKHRRDDS